MAEERGEQVDDDNINEEDRSVSSRINLSKTVLILGGIRVTDTELFNEIQERMFLLVLERPLSLDLEDLLLVLLHPTALPLLPLPLLNPLSTQLRLLEFLPLFAFLLV